MNCTICGKPIVLIPSAEERARKDVTGKTAAYYTSLFTTHSACELKKRAEDTRALMKARGGK
jgi:hypothetical protein